MNITRRMSDSHIYELEDIVWDDFSISDDHLVPHPQIQQIEVSTGQNESHKKVKHEAGVRGSPGSQRVEVGPTTEKASSSYPQVKRDRALDNGSWSHNPNASQIYDDLMTRLSSEGTTIASGDFISNRNLYIGDPNPANESFSLRGASQPGTDVSYLHEHDGIANKETDDPLFYEWPEIENFDVDQMLRTRDSTFGFGDSGKEDEMCWFSSSTGIDGSNAATKLQVRSTYDSDSLKILAENVESPYCKYESLGVDAFDKRSAGANHTSSTLASNGTEQSCLSKASSIIELPICSDKIDSEKPSNEGNTYIRAMDYQKPVETNFSLDSSKPTQKAELSFSISSQKFLSLKCKGLQEENENFNKSSQLNERSFEESSFRQLQEVVEQLDLRTKLRIRDSLYRLSRSAEQRLGASTVSRVGQAGTEHAGFLDIETDTNPIDRSIAHLLFHRPNDPSKLPLSYTGPGHNPNDVVKQLFGNDNFNDADLLLPKKEE